jgi:toxin ParE1/3/4
VKRKLIFRPEAEVDLDAIYEFIAQHSPTNAIAFTRRIREHCMMLLDFPERGTRRNDLRSGIRIVGLERRVSVAFAVMEDRIEVARILYGGRDIESALREDPPRDDSST